MDGIRISPSLVWVCGFDPRRWHGWHPTAATMADEPNTRCTQCGYEWTYSGHGEPKPVATCPECGNKTPTLNIETEATNE